MDLLKYLEPMKNLPERFSNLAFWRGVRKLRDEVVNAFEYVDSWGENIESSLGLTLISKRACTSSEITLDFTNVYNIEKVYLKTTVTISPSDIPSDAKFIMINGTADISESRLYSISLPISAFTDDKSYSFWVGNLPLFDNSIALSISTFNITLTFFK